jgi:hypothetical protein
VHCDRADAVLEEEEGVLDALHRGERKELGISGRGLDLMWRKMWRGTGPLWMLHACVFTVFVLYPLYDRLSEGTSE